MCTGYTGEDYFRLFMLTLSTLRTIENDTLYAYEYKNVFVFGELLPSDTDHRRVLRLGGRPFSD